jgi:hypothetical protein
MKVNLSLEVTDEQRNVLACMLAGKPIKGQAKREDVRAFVEGCIGGLTKKMIPAPPTKAPAKNLGEYDVGDGRTVTVESGPGVHERYVEAFWALLTDEERAKAEELKAEGKSDGYIRGYFYIERAERRGGKPLKGTSDRKRSARRDDSAEPGDDAEEE